MPPQIIRDIFTRIRSKFFGAIGQYNLVKPILVDHEGALLQLDINGNLLTAPGGGGAVWGLFNEDTAAVDGDLGQAILAVRNDGANTVLTSANGDYSWISVDDRGQVFVRTDPSPAEPWQTLRVFAATPADGVLDPTVLQAVGPGGVDLSVAVYPWNALIGLTVDVNGQSYTFLAGDVVSEAAILLALNTAITDINWTVTAGPPDFLVGTKLSPGNIVLSGTAVVTLGLAAGTTGNWVALPQSRGLVEVSYLPNFSVANDPKEIIFRLWRLSADTGGIAEIAGEIRLPTGYGPFTSSRFSFDGTAAYLTVAFVGGTVPTITGTAEIRVVYDGDQFAQLPTMHSVTPAILSTDEWDNAPTHDIYNYAVSRGDGAAVRATNSTIDFAGPALTSDQLRRVLAILTGNNLPLVWEQGRNAKLTIAAGGPSGQIITVAAFDGTSAPIPAIATILDVMWSDNDKAIVLGLGGPVFAEDSAHTTGDLGIEMLAVRRDVAISSGGSDGDYVTLNEDADGYLYVTVKGYDSASNSVRVSETAPVWAHNVATPVSIIGAAQVVTGAWADLGPEIPLQGYTKIGLWLNLDINDSDNVRVRVLFKHTSAGANEYPIPITSVDVTGPPFNLKVQPEYIEFDVNADQLMAINFDVYNWVPFVQFRVMAEVAGATPAQILDAVVTYGYGGA